MKRVNNVFDKVCDELNIFLAHRNASRSKLHYPEVIEVENNLDEKIKELKEMLLNKTYEVKYQDYKIKKINDKGKERQLMILPYFPHRIVQWAIMLQLEEMFLKNFIDTTYASIRNRGIHKAMKDIDRVLKKHNLNYCLKLDINKYYPSINNRILFEKIKRKIKDKDILWLLEKIIFSTGEKGQPIGSLWSQWAGNFYLSELDHYCKEKLKLKHYFRYCDDIVILSNSKQELHKSFLEIKKILEKDDLTIKNNYQIFNIKSRGVDFLGYRFFKDYKLLRKKIAKRAKTKLISIKNKKILSFKESCVIGSLNGWLRCCNSYRFREKYINVFKNRKFINCNGEIRRLKCLK